MRFSVQRIAKLPSNPYHGVQPLHGSSIRIRGTAPSGATDVKKPTETLQVAGFFNFR